MSARIAVKVVPGASASEVAGWMGTVLRVRVTAPAERGRANAAVEALLAECLGVPAAAVRIVSGGGSPRKVVEIAGLNEADVRARLNARA